MKDGTRVVQAGLPERSRAGRSCPVPSSRRPSTTRRPRGRGLRLRPRGQPDMDRVRARAVGTRGRRGGAVGVGDGRGRRRPAHRAASRRRVDDADRLLTPLRDVAAGHIMERNGVEVTSLPTASMAVPRSDRRALARVAVQPGLDLCDIGALAAAAPRARCPRGRRQHLRHAARPAALGAGRRPLRDERDKHLGGHADLLLGYVAAADPARAERCGPGAATRAPSPVRSRPGWRTARSPRSTSGSSGARPTPRARGAAVGKGRASPLPGRLSIPPTSWHGGR